VLRLNRLEPTFQTVCAVLSDAVAARSVPELDHLVDSFPVMPARHGHSYRARVGREVADTGFCAARRTRFDGVRLHCIAQRRVRRLPLPGQVCLCSASHHDSQAFIQQQPALPPTELFGDLAYATPRIIAHLRDQQARLIAPRKKPKGKELTDDEKYYNRLVRRIRQPVESFVQPCRREDGHSKSEQSALN